MHECKMQNAECKSEYTMLKNGHDIRERTFELAVRIVKLCQYLDEKPGVGRTLSKQILRSGTSIGANIEEAKAAQRRADFITKCTIAQKEARETHYWLRLLTATELVPSERIADLLTEAEQMTCIVAAIIVAARKNAG
jgi:four helix bundle protein